MIGVRDLPPVFSYNQTTGRITLSANMRNGIIYRTIEENFPGLNILSGSCPTVGVGGLVLSGGHGVQTNYYGIATHYLESVEMVTPNGSFVRVNDQNDPDLMWALRGGGHNLGVVTKFVFDYSSIPHHNWNLVMYNCNNASSTQF